MTKLPPPRAIDIEILAMTLWAEAADKPVRAIEALAALVMNRLKAGRDPDARHIAAICRAPFLFSCWNRRDPRHAALRAIPPGDLHATMRPCASTTDLMISSPASAKISPVSKLTASLARYLVTRASAASDSEVVVSPSFLAARALIF